MRRFTRGAWRGGGSRRIRDTKARLGRTTSHVFVYCRSAGWRDQRRRRWRKLRRVSGTVVYGGGAGGGERYEHAGAVDWGYGERGCVPEAVEHIAAGDGAVDCDERDRWIGWRGAVDSNAGADFFAGTAVAAAGGDAVIRVRQAFNRADLGRDLTHIEQPGGGGRFGVRIDRGGVRRVLRRRHRNHEPGDAGGDG